MMVKHQMMLEIIGKDVKKILNVYLDDDVMMKTFKEFVYGWLVIKRNDIKWKKNIKNEKK